MVLNGQHISNSRMNTVSSMPPKKKRMNRSSKSLEDFSKVVGSNGVIRKPLMSRARSKDCTPNAMKKTESSDEDAEFEKQFGKGRFFDDSDCSWLSSDCLSASSFFDQYKYLGSHQSVDEWLAAWLSKVSWGKSVITATLDLEGDLKDDVASSWLLMSFESDDSLSSPCFSEDTASSDNSSTHSSWILDSQTHDLDRANLMLSRSTSSSSDYLIDLVSEQVDFTSENVSRTIAEVNIDEIEPIFWPFKGKFDSDPEETMRYLTISPRKEVNVRATPKSKVPPRSGHRESPRRQLQCEPTGSNSNKRSESNQSSGKSIGKVKTTASSRFSRNLKSSTKVVPRALEEESTIPPNKPSPPFCEEDISSGFNYDLPIEELLGLSEFDGREGLEGELDGDIFFSCLMSSCNNL